MPTFTLAPKLELGNQVDEALASRDGKLELSSLYTSVSKLVIPAGIAGIQATWTYLSSPSMALDTRFPAGMTTPEHLCITMRAGAWEPAQVTVNVDLPDKEFA